MLCTQCRPMISDGNYDLPDGTRSKSFSKAARLGRRESSDWDHPRPRKRHKSEIASKMQNQLIYVVFGRDKRMGVSGATSIYRRGISFVVVSPSAQTHISRLNLVINFFFETRRNRTSDFLFIERAHNDDFFHSLIICLSCRRDPFTSLATHKSIIFNCRGSESSQTQCQCRFVVQK